MVGLEAAAAAVAVCGVFYLSVVDDDVAPAVAPAPAVVAVAAVVALVVAAAASAVG